jgi:hypothetical protein
VIPPDTTPIALLALARQAMSLLLLRKNTLGENERNYKKAEHEDI